MKISNENKTEYSEIARINKDDTADSIFPYAEWEIKIFGGDDDPPHFHIIKDDWDVSFNIEDGTLLSINTQGANQNIFDYMCHNVNLWLNSKNYMIEKVTNREVAMVMWIQIE